jgi:Ni/Co efflux regulator RcnB
MHKYSALSTRLALILVGLLAAAPAMADKPEWAGKGKGKGKGQDEARVAHFRDQHQTVLRDYYGEQYRSTQSCPPGLAKKNNGCLPPGQAKKWQLGRPLPRDVVYYEVPPDLITRIGPPPPGYRYVRVGGDILLVKTEGAIIVDALRYLVGR